MTRAYVNSFVPYLLTFTPASTPGKLRRGMAGAVKSPRPRNTVTTRIKERVTMSDTHSTPPVQSGKPAKPRPDFPLFAHAAGVWAKKIRGKLHYFGPWDDPDGALKKYHERKDA